jgi:site-specific DNA-adenine methylase
MKQGTRANFTGRELEDFVASILEKRGYTKVEQRKFEPSEHLNQPIYARRYDAGKNVYGTASRVDFVLYHPKKHHKCLIIEAKWQQTGGSVDEKYPFLILNIKNQHPYETILILDGGGYKRGACEWIRSQVGDNFKALFDMAGFQKWANSDNL